MRSLVLHMIRPARLPGGFAIMTMASRPGKRFRTGFLFRLLAHYIVQAGADHAGGKLEKISRLKRRGANVPMKKDFGTARRIKS